MTNPATVLRGLESARSKLAKTRLRLLSRAAVALNRENKAIFNRSQQIVPVVKGNLQRSGETQDATADNLTASTTYGDERVNYAVYVHEGPHSLGRKFLEIPMNEAEPGMSQRVASAIKL